MQIIGLTTRTRRIVIMMMACTAASGVAFTVPIASAAPAVPTIAGVVNNHFGVPSGASGGGARITVNGTHFVNVEKVTFGGIPGRHVAVLSPRTLTVTLPAHP